MSLTSVFLLIYRLLHRKLSKFHTFASVIKFPFIILVQFGVQFRISPVAVPID